MHQSQSWVKPVFSAFCLVLSILGWMILSPTAIGGRTTYIILIGNSMEPDFRRGDLVLVQPALTYNIDDIVAYAQPDIGTVFHRIIDTNDDGFVMKGDHNSWEDFYFPNEEEIIGKFWIKLSSVGTYIHYLRQPVPLSLLVITFLGLILFSMIYENPRKKRNDNQKANGMDKKISDYIYLISAIVFSALILAIVSFSRPLQGPTEDNVEYTHKGNFNYYSYASENVYENNILQSGDPIFRELNNSFNIIFSYELDSDQKANIQGTYRLLGEISEASGWNRTIEIVPLSLIVENSFISEGVLELSDIQALTDNYEAQTGIYNNRYTLTIKPEIILQGRIGDRDFSDTFIPELPFSYDEQKLVLIEDKSSDTDVLNPVQESAVLGSKEAPNTISIFGFKLNVLMGRLISIYTLFFSIIAFSIVLWKQKKVNNVSIEI